MNLDELQQLAGISSKKNIPREMLNTGSNISLTATEKAQLMKKHNIKPGTDQWFQLWFSKPYLTGEKPIGK